MNIQWRSLRYENEYSREIALMWEIMPCPAILKMGNIFVTVIISR